MLDVSQDQLAISPGPLVMVDDPDDVRLDLYRGLNDPAARVRIDCDHSVFMVEGKLAVDRLLGSKYAIRSLLVDDHQFKTAGALVRTTRAMGAPVFVGTRAVVAGTVGFAMHRGVVAVGNRLPPTSPEQLVADSVGSSGPGKDGSLLAVLEGLNDHENIGALFRNAAAFGVSGVLLDPRCADPLYRRSIRVSVGHALQVPFARLSPWPAALDHVKQAGFVVVALAPKPAASLVAPPASLSEVKAMMSGPSRPAGVALLLGAEGPGLSEAALAASDLMVSIPMAHNVDSLNVATAAAVAFHALVDF